MSRVTSKQDALRLLSDLQDIHDRHPESRAAVERLEDILTKEFQITEQERVDFDMADTRPALPREAAVKPNDVFYIDHIGGAYEVLYGRKVMSREPDPDGAYGVVQRWAMDNKKKAMVVDMDKGTRSVVDAHGNIDDFDEDIVSKDAGLGRGKTEGGAGGLKGHSQMAHWEKTEEVKERARKQRRQQSRQMERHIGDMMAGVGTDRRREMESKSAYTGSPLKTRRDYGNRASTEEDDMLMKKTATKALDSIADRLEMLGMRVASEKIDVLSNTIDATNWGIPPFEGRPWSNEPWGENPTKAMKNFHKALEVLGWQGGTIHQVSRETGLTVEQIREADDIERLVKDALKKRGKIPKEAATLVGDPYVVQQIKRAGFEVSRYPGDLELSNMPVHNKDLEHIRSYSWTVSAPADMVFDVDGIELDDLVLNTPGAGLKEETGHFGGKTWDDYKYLVFKPTPGAAMSQKVLVFGSNKEQELILKLKSMLKPEGFSKQAGDVGASNGMVFPVHYSDSPEHPELKKVFTWLTKYRMGPKFGSRPIGWYQMHMMAAIDIIEDAVKKSSGTGEVRVEDGMLLGKKDGRWEKLMSCEEVYSKADKNSRK